MEHPDGSPFLPSGFPESQDFTLCQVCSPQSLPRWTRPLSDHCCHPRTVHTGPCSFPTRRGLPPQPQTLSPAPPALLGVRGSHGGEKAGVGKRLLDLAWPLGNAGQGACPCGVSHTAPLEAHPLKERGPHRCASGRPGVRGGVGTPSCLHPWSWAGPCGYVSRPLCYSISCSRSSGAAGGPGENWSLFFLTLPVPASPSLLLLTLQASGEAQEGGGSWAGSPSPPGAASSVPPLCPALGTQTRPCPCGLGRP